MVFIPKLLFGGSNRGKSRKKKEAGAARPSDGAANRPAIEVLEDRLAPTCNTISGHVFSDANNNGIFDLGETPIAGSTVELRDANGIVVATDVTDANGYYEFTHDRTVNTAPAIIEQTVTIPSTLAGFSLRRLIDQFDPSLGELIEVEIINQGSITSEIRAENQSTLVGSPINATVSGRIILQGSGFTIETIVSQNAGSFDATAYDGTLDFGGSSGKQFAPVTVTAAPKSVKLTGGQLAPFIGTGDIELTETVEVSSTASGGGNLLVGISSQATTTFTVRYKYVPSNCLKPGDYTIVQTSQPPLSPGSSQRYLDGLESRNGVVLPGSVGTDAIAVTLGDQDLINNDFAELRPASLSGFVYYDENNDGIRQTDTVGGQLREPGIAGVRVTLVRQDLDGLEVIGQAITGADGSYRFDNLRPGNYILTEEQPAGFYDGKDAAGTQGGTADNDLISNIPLQAGVQGTENNFGEVHGARLSGAVFHDLDDDGIRDAGEPGIGNVTVKLSGTTLDGATVQRQAVTAADGSYSFTELPPGVYSVEEVQPAAFLDGKDAVGSHGGDLGSDRIDNILLSGGDRASGYNFGERIAADVGIVKTVDRSSVLAGATVVYTLTVTNHGPSTAQNVRIEDPLTPLLRIVTVNAPGWTVAQAPPDATNPGGRLILTRNSLASGESSTITITAEAPIDPGTYLNTARVTMTTLDYNLNNNQSTAQVTVRPPVVNVDPPPQDPPPQNPPPQNPPPPTDGQVLTKAVILSSGDFWFNVLRQRI